MKYLSVCSGIEAATMAWHDLGWKPAGFSEIEPFPSAVLAHHYPDVTNFGDMTKFKEWNLDTVNLLVGGTPCQSFSVAGLRKGLEDPRGNLALTYVGILDKFRPKWCVWENVPGVLSSNRGRDFGSFLGALGELGYGFAYRVLDAQYFGVAQRRRRVFVVGYFGDWRPAAAVLFEPESLRRNIKKGRSEGKEVAATITARFGNSRNNHEELAPIWPANTASTLNASFGNKLGLENQHINSGAPLFVPAYVESSLAQYKQGDIGGTLKASGGVLGGGSETFLVQNEGQTPVLEPIPLNTMTMMGRPSDDGRMGSGIGSPGDPCPTITKAHSHAVAHTVWDTTNITSPQNGSNPKPNDPCHTLAKGQHPPLLTGMAVRRLTEVGGTFQPIVLEDQGGSVMRVNETGVVGTLRRESHGHEPSIIQQMAVRRLTPVECERLQGFPDNYTDIKPKGKDTPDGPRYKALGNSMAVPCMSWLGKRIQMVEDMTNG